MTRRGFPESSNGSSVKVIAALLLLPALLTAAIDSSAADPSAAHALGLQQRGRFDLALTEWQAVAAAAADAGDAAARTDALLGTAATLRSLGHGAEALAAAASALRLAQSGGDQVRSIQAHQLVAAAAILAGRHQQAREALDAARALATAADRRDLLAGVHNEIGNLHYEGGRHPEALAAYVEAAALAAGHGQSSLHAQALLNAARTAQDAGTDPPAATYLERAARVIDTLETGHGKAMALIALGELGMRAAPADPQAMLRAHQAYRGALAIAEPAGDSRVQSFALGYLGHLYEQAGRLDEAAQLTRRAIFAAPDAAAADLLYRWHWQNGRIQKAAGRPDDAIAAYRLAVQYVQGIRDDLALNLAGGRSSFRAVLGPVYFELADLLLARGASLNAGAEFERIVEEARATIELSKAAELQDYFQDGCVAEQQARVSSLAQVGAGTAVIYPILLPGRTEVIVTFADGSRQFSVAIGAGAVTELVRDYRIKLERRTTRQYLLPAQKLYDILIRPLEPELRKRAVHTLVFVPDGPLRTVPMGALHDGSDFLVARYALATTPGMSLTETRPLQQRAVQLLLNGITVPVQGFPALPAVAEELQSLQKLYAATTLKDQDFLIANVERELGDKPFSVVHIASHGEFNGDVNQTFLLAFDQKLTMNRLEALIGPSRYRTQPIEMLTLSACQSAAGDDRAALGLAGVAIKAGVRSALASLWYINDESTASLMTDFYRQLGLPGFSKARALQQAQLALGRDARYRHPYFWAPFLLIGNWL